MRIALIGTRGVPARYGGFETAVEEIGKRLVQMGHEVTVFCRGDGERTPQFLGMKLVHLPAAKKRALETLSHTALSVLHPALSGVDAAILFNAANSPLLPVLRARGIPTACHVDGLEWRRAKWGPTGQKYYRMAESLAVRWADALIADAPGIASYYADEFGADTVQIAYGAPILTDIRPDKVAEIGLTPGEYHLVVARAEPENHVLEIVQGYVASTAQKPLIVVGSAPYADEYLAQISAAADDRVRLLGSVWDQELLDQLYGNALTYLHGHCVGGTNPSLLRAAGAGAFTIAYAVSFNEDIVGDNGEYFTTPADVARKIEQAESDPQRCRARGLAFQQAIRAYNWDDVAAKYEQLGRNLADGRAVQRFAPKPDHSAAKKRPSGRRVGNARDPKSILVAHPGTELDPSGRMLLESVAAFIEAGPQVTVALPGTGPLSQAMIARGAQVEVCETPRFDKSGLRPKGLAAYLASKVRAVPIRRRLIAQTKADLVFCNTITSPAWSLAAKLSARPILVHVPQIEHSQALTARLRNVPLLWADWVFVDSEFTLDTLGQSWPSLRHRSSVVDPQRMAELIIGGKRG